MAAARNTPDATAVLDVHHGLRRTAASTVRDGREGEVRGPPVFPELRLERATTAFPSGMHPRTHRGHTTAGATGRAGARTASAACRQRAAFSEDGRALAHVFCKRALGSRHDIRRATDANGASLDDEDGSVVGACPVAHPSTADRQPAPGRRRSTAMTFCCPFCRCRGSSCRLQARVIRIAFNYPSPARSASVRSSGPLT
jgi:hypothetical protein